MTDVDPFVREVTELLAAKDRMISSLTHDVETLLEALSKHEGYDTDATSFRHLGRTL